MANFVTADDKRIYDLQTIADNIADYFLALDKPGLTSAKKVSIPSLLSYLSNNAVKQLFLSGSVNPDNGLGSNGDFYAKVPNDGSSLEVYQKISGVWQSIFRVDVGGGGSGNHGIDKYIESYIATSDDEANYAIDMSGEDGIPSPSLKPFVTVNGDEANSAYTWNPNTKIISNIQVSEGDELTIYWIGRPTTPPSTGGFPYTFPFVLS